MVLVVFISAEVGESVGHGPSVYQLGHMFEEVENPI